MQPTSIIRSMVNRLVAEGDGSAAAELLEAMLVSGASDEELLVDYLDVLVAIGQPRKALELLSSTGIEHEGPTVLLKRLLDVLVRTRDSERAKQIIERKLWNNPSVEDLSTLFNFIAVFYSGAERVQMWRRFQCCVQDDREVRDTHSWLQLQELKASLLFALRDYHAFLAQVGIMEKQAIDYPRRSIHTGVAAAVKRHLDGTEERKKVFVIGLPRTGTSSMASALRVLGLNTLHFMNTVTNEMISPQDFPIFDAFSDAPICASVERCIQMYPEAHFIMTTRPIEAWQKSIISHFWRYYGFDCFDEAKAAMTCHVSFNWGKEFTDMYMSLFFQYSSYEEAYRVYHSHIADLSSGIRSFHVHTVNDGWGELPYRLGYRLPTTPFPWENRGLI